MDPQVLRINKTEALLVVWINFKTETVKSRNF